MNPPQDPCTCNCMDCIEGSHCGIGIPNYWDGMGTHCYYPNPEELEDELEAEEWDEYCDDMYETGTGR